MGTYFYLLSEEKAEAIANESVEVNWDWEPDRVRVGKRFGALHCNICNITYCSYEKFYGVSSIISGSVVNPQILIKK